MTLEMETILVLLAFYVGGVAIGAAPWMRPGK